MSEETAGNEELKPPRTEAEWELFLNEITSSSERLRATDKVSLAEMLSEPEPFIVRGKVFYKRFLSIRGLGRLVRLFRYLVTNLEMMDDEQQIRLIGALGSLFIYVEDSADGLELRPATESEIVDSFSPPEFLTLVQDYLENNGWEKSPEKKGTPAS